MRAWERSERAIKGRQLYQLCLCLCMCAAGRGMCAGVGALALAAVVALLVIYMHAVVQLAHNDGISAPSAPSDLA